MQVTSPAQKCSAQIRNTWAILKAMSIDFTAIVNSPTYSFDQKLFLASGMEKSKIVLLLGLFLIPPLWPILIVYIILHRTKSRDLAKDTQDRQAALSAFAATNNFRYQSSKDGSLTPDSPLELPYTFHSIEKVFHKLTGTLNNCPFEYLNLTVVLEDPAAFAQRAHIYGEGAVVSVPRMTLTLLRVQLPVSMPRLLANSRFNTVAGLNPESNNFQSLTDHVLEGDFPTYYTVRAEEGNQIESYSILTPEVMLALKETRRFDLWMYQNELDLIGIGTELEYLAGTPTIFKNAELLLAQIDRTARVR